MKNKILLVFLAMVLVVSLVAFAACAKEEEAPPVEEEEVWEWPETLIMGTTGVGSMGHAQGVSLAAALEETTGMKVRVIPEEAFRTTILRIKNGTYDLGERELGFISAHDMEALAETASRDLGPFQVRIVWNALILYLGFGVRADSDIKTIQDLKPGVRLATCVGIPAVESAMLALAAWAGLDEEDVVLVPFGTYSGSIRSIAEGKADVAISAPTNPTLFEVAAGPHGLRCLELPYDEDPEGAGRFLALEPAYSFGRPNVGTEEFMGKRMTCLPTMEFTRAETDPELVYHLAKWFHEEYDVYEPKHPENYALHIDILRSILDTTPIPVHEGVIKYLREIGKWTADDDARQEYNVDLLTRYVEAYQEAIAEADAHGIEVHPDNEAWLELWSNYKKEHNIPHLVPYVEVP